MTPLEEALVAVFAADLQQARRIADTHTLDKTGRCRTCHAGGVHPFGCTLGEAANIAIRDAKPTRVERADSPGPSLHPYGAGGQGEAREAV